MPRRSRPLKDDRELVAFNDRALWERRDPAEERGGTVRDPGLCVHS